MLERFRARLAAAPGSALWLAPAVRAVEAVRDRLLDWAAALFGARLHTFHEVLEEVVRANDPAARPLGAVQRRLLAEDLVAELAAASRLPHFAAVAETRGFTEGVLGLLTDLQRNAVPADQFAGAAGAKERQCARLYEHYRRELRGQHLHDADGLAAAAGELLRRGARRPFEAVRAVFVDGFSDFTRSQHEFLEGLCGWVEELWVALPGEADCPPGSAGVPPAFRPEGGRDARAPGGDGRAELFARPRATLERLAPLRPRVEVVSDGEPARPAGLAHLARQLFRPLQSVEQSGDTAGVECVEAPGALGEARLVARRITALLRDGTPPDDVLAVLRDVAPYADLLGEVFDEYEIPYEMEGSEPLTRNPAAALFLRAVRLPEDDWPFTGVTALLRNTYFRPRWPEAAGETATRAEALLRLLGKPRGRDAYLTAVERWAEQQQPGLEDEQAEESRRRRTHELAKECGLFLRRFFHAWDAAPGRAPLADHLAWLRRFAFDLGVTPELVEDDRDRAALRLLLDEADAWLDRERRRHGGRRALDRKTFHRRLSALAAEAGLPRTPAGPGRVRVRVLSANQARHLEADYVFVMGLGERGFPRLAPPHALFDEAERQAPRQAGVDLGGADPLPEEMLLFYQVVTRARRRLVLSRPAVDERGQELLPSSFYSAVLGCFAPGAVPVEQRRMLIEGFDRDEPLSAAERRVRTAARWDAGGAADLELPPDLRANLTDAAALVRRRFHEKEHNPYDGHFRDPAVVAELAQQFGPDRVFSPTALEDYVACPFRFFLRHVLRLEPLEEPSEEIEVTRRGQAVHRALARLHDGLKEAGCHGPDGAVTEHAVREVSAAVAEDVKRAPSLAAQTLWRLEGERLLRVAERYVEQWRKFVKPWEGRAAVPRPHLFEVEFGLPESPHGPLVVRVGDVEVRVSGRIDRVDLAEWADGVGFWIIDYKTGRSTNYTGADLAAYRKLQLTLYALAVEEVLLAGRNARPLGLAYWLVGEEGPKVALPGRQAAQWLEDGRRWPAVRGRLREWVATLVRHIRQGAFSLQPRQEHCTLTCPYGQVCRITQARGVGKEGLLSLPVVEIQAAE
jgi:ATP-dependent helicase/DNAse subunit B